MSVLANSFRGLHQVFDLRDVGIGVAVVHQLVEEFRRLPNALLAFLQSPILFVLLLHERYRLMSMIEAIELGHARIGFWVVLTKFRLRLAFLIAAGDEVVPLVDVLQRIRSGRSTHFLFSFW